MARETMHKACRAFACGVMIDFLLFGMIALTIGGDALSGKIEGGHYYLGNHGCYTEVNRIVFLYSKLHGLSVFATYPLLVPASIIYWLTGGNKSPSSAMTSVIKQPPTNPMSRINYAINSFLWKASDLVEGISWSLFDSWRRPSVEFFTRCSRRECMIRLFEALNLEASTSRSKRPVIGYLSGTYFSLLKQPRIIREVSVIVFGKFSSTPQGTYVRAWCRLPGIVIMLLSLMFSIPLGFFGYGLTSRVLIPAILPELQIEWPSWPVGVLFLLSAVGLALLFVWISSACSERSIELGGFLKHALKQRAR
jgi:hypothetical protein